MIDLLGKVVLTKEGLSSKESVSINEELNTGIYFCVFKSNNQVIERIKVKKI